MPQQHSSDLVNAAFDNGGDASVRHEIQVNLVLVMAVSQCMSYPLQRHDLARCREHASPRRAIHPAPRRRRLCRVRSCGVRRRRGGRGFCGGRTCADVRHCRGLVAAVPTRVLRHRDRGLSSAPFRLELGQLFHEAHVWGHDGPPRAGAHEGVVERVALVRDEVGDDRRGAARHPCTAMHKDLLVARHVAVNELCSLRPKPLDRFSAHILNVNTVVL
mmetsp:Transcript_74877/g.211135  ORF Transcript_74877/g.211135 Transcript_74877/m.211135 type:complete len:217 (+) Transcript_74877:522-1172(+)